MNQDLFEFESYRDLRRDLGRSIGAVYGRGTPAERSWLVKMWSEVVDALSPSMTLPERDTSLQALRMVSAVLNEQRLFPPARERPDWLTTDLLGSLSEEALARRRTEVMHTPRATHATVGTVAKELAGSSTFRTWATQRASLKFEEGAHYNYIFYERSGHYCPMHIDKPDSYPINCLIPLAHVGGGRTRPCSTLVVIGEDGKIDQIGFAAGEALLFSSSATVHGRTPVEADELVVLLSIGLQPLGADVQPATASG